MEKIRSSPCSFIHFPICEALPFEDNIRLVRIFATGPRPKTLSSISSENRKFRAAILPGRLAIDSYTHVEAFHLRSAFQVHGADQAHKVIYQLLSVNLMVGDRLQGGNLLSDRERLGVQFIAVDRWWTGVENGRPPVCVFILLM